MHPSRLFGLAAVLFKGVCAGTIDSSSGNATVTPAPRRNVRRERCLFVMNMGLISSQENEQEAANYANDAKWAHQRILDAPIWRHSRNSRLLVHFLITSPSSETARPSRCREQATKSDNRFQPHRE